MKQLRYIYTAIDHKGAVRQGYMNSDNILTIREDFLKKQWIIVELKIAEVNEFNDESYVKQDIFSYVKKWSGKVRLLLSLFVYQKLSSKQLLYFTQNLSSLLKSGLSLSVSLSVMLEQEKSFRFQAVLKNVMDAMSEGASFSDTLILSKVSWGSDYLHAIQAADRSGRLEMVLDVLQIELERKVEFENKLRSALIYPAFVLVLSVLVVVLLLIFVVPQFSSMLSYLSPTAVLPVGTRVVLSLSQFIYGSWWVLFCLLPLTGLLCSWISKTNLANRYRDKFLWHFPVIGKTLHLIEIEQMLYTLHILTASGVHIIEALLHIQNGRGSLTFKTALSAAYQRVLEGMELSDALGFEKVFPLWLKNNLKIGEQSGMLEDAFKKSAELIRTEINRSIKLITTFIEPLLVLILAIVIGGLVICLFWPILEIVQQMSEF